MARDASAERERLREERDHASEVRVDHRDQADRLRAELKPIPKERDAALRRQARGVAGVADVAKLDQRERELRAELEREIAAAKAAAAAVRDVESELVRLHHDRFADFAEGAERLTAEAAAKLSALRESYVEAFGAIEAARREWDLITRDRNRIVLDRLSPADRAHGEHRRAVLSPPPPNPLRPPGEVFSAPPNRPPEIEPAEGAG
ncbi:MAG TPA: hypothetical protein VK932_24260 [Kofleriaceae bacterium]|nr:hypothetical protein [Kofleriaceae bacterium]